MHAFPLPLSSITGIVRVSSPKYPRTAAVTKVLLLLAAVPDRIGVRENGFWLVVSGESTQPDKV
jgi:hypothetical protein